MLLANEAVGERLAQAKVPGIWRVHDDPDPAAVESLVKMFEHLAVPTPPLPDAFTGRAAARLTSDIAVLVRQYVNAKGRGELAYLPRVLRALQRARYDAAPGWHSGLAAKNYAHFTSPIRRYPDLVNHRSLLRLLGLSDEAPAAIDVSTIAEHVSWVEGESVAVERRANAVALSHRMFEGMYDRNYSLASLGADNVDRFTGEVVGLIASGCFVRFGSVFDGFVPARTMSAAERYDLDETGLALVGGKSGHTITLGDVIKVRVDGVDRSAGKISLRLA